MPVTTTSLTELIMTHKRVLSPILNVHTTDCISMPPIPYMNIDGGNKSLRSAKRGHKVYKSVRNLDSLY